MKSKCEAAPTNLELMPKTLLTPFKLFWPLRFFSFPSSPHSNVRRYFPIPPERGLKIPLKFLIKSFPAPRHFILQAPDTLEALQAPSKPAKVLKPTILF